MTRHGRADDPPWAGFWILTHKFGRGDAMVVTVVPKLTAVSAGRSSVGRQRGSPGGAGDGSLVASHLTWQRLT